MDSVYLENIGEDILFLWVEKVDCISLNPDVTMSTPSLFFGVNIKQPPLINGFWKLTVHFFRQGSSCKAMKAVKGLQMMLIY